MSDTADLFRKRLERALAAHGAVTEFCRVTGFSRSAVAKWISGASSPTLDSLDKIASGLHTTVVELLGQTGLPASASPKAKLLDFILTSGNEEEIRDALVVLQDLRAARAKLLAGIEPGKTSADANQAKRRRS